MSTNSSPYGNNMNNFCAVLDAKTNDKIRFNSREEFENFFKNENSTFILVFFGKLYIVKNFILLSHLGYTVEYMKGKLSDDIVIIRFKENFSTSKFEKILNKTHDESMMVLKKLTRGFVFTKELFATIKVLNNGLDMNLNKDGIFSDFIR